MSSVPVSLSSGSATCSRTSGCVWPMLRSPGRSRDCNRVARCTAPRNLAPPKDASVSVAVRLTLVVVASTVAGAINAIAGGGTLLTFPALVGLGIPPHRRQRDQHRRPLARRREQHVGLPRPSCAAPAQWASASPCPVLGRRLRRRAAPRSGPRDRDSPRSFPGWCSAPPGCSSLQARRRRAAPPAARPRHRHRRRRRTPTLRDDSLVSIPDRDLRRLLRCRRGHPHARRCSASWG